MIKRKQVIELLKIKALALSMAGVISLTGCGSEEVNPDHVENVTYKGIIYLVPYDDKLYAVTREHIDYPLMVVAYEGSTNKHEVIFYKSNNQVFGRVYHPSEVYTINSQSQASLDYADKVLEENGQEPLSPYLVEETTLKLEK